MRCVCVLLIIYVCVRDGEGLPDLRPKFVVTQSIVFREFVIFFGGESFFLAFFLAESYIFLSESFLFGGVIYFLV